MDNPMISPTGVSLDEVLDVSFSLGFTSSDMASSPLLAPSVAKFSSASLDVVISIVGGVCFVSSSRVGGFFRGLVFFRRIERGIDVICNSVNIMHNITN